LFLYIVLVLQKRMGSFGCHCSINWAPFKVQDAWLKLIALGCSIVVLALANTDDLSGFVSSLEVHDKWLVQSSAVGATIFLLIIVVSYFIGEPQSRRTEAMFLFTYAGLYLYSGSIMIMHYKDSNSDMGKAMGSMAIISGGVMGVEFINELLHIYKTR